MSEPALVNFAPEKHSVELRPFDPPPIGESDVLLKVGAVGVCGSDLHQWTATHSWNVNYPVVLGHEFAGTITEVGDRVTGWKVGDRVTSETAAEIDPDNALTRMGLYNLDPTRRGFGYDVDGAMTRFVRVPDRCLHRLPDSLTFAKAALTEPCCVAYNAAVNNSDIRPGDRVVVIGPGPIGMLCAAIARLRGADVAIVGLATDKARLETARHYKVAALVDDVDQWAAAGDGQGVDGVIDAAGVSETLETALRIVRPAGWITKVGWGHQPPDFSLDPLIRKNIRLQGSFSHNWPIWERVLQMLAAGTLDVEPIIGGVWRFEQWQDAFETMHACKIVKAVLRP